LRSFKLFQKSRRCISCYKSYYFFEQRASDLRICVNTNVCRFERTHERCNRLCV